MPEAGAPIRASVVIPASRPVRLGFALEALASQTLDAEHFEVVVVRDGAWPAPAPPPGLDVRILDGPGDANIAVLRNLGWRAARAPLVVFTDDDCRPVPDWLELIVGAGEGGGGPVQGRTEPDPDEEHLLHGLARSQDIRGPSPWFETCNMAYPRALLERLDGFDQRFSALGEDADLALRARRLGVRFDYLDEALVWHAVIPRALAGALREATRRDTIPLLVARHPDQRAALYRGVFWKRSHALLLLAAAGMVTRRPALAAAAAFPYLRANTDSRALAGPRRIVRQAGHLAARALVDGVEVVATARAAIRDRSFVL